MITGLTSKHRQLDWFPNSIIASIGLKLAIIAWVACGTARWFPACAEAQESVADHDDSAITVPSPPDVVAKMLELAKLTPEDLVYDLGCGDGRIVVEAARRYGCRAVGYEINPRMIEEARANVARTGVAQLVTIEKQDIFQLDLRKATVITLYLLPEMNDRLVPQLKQLRNGARIVCHEFPIDRFEHDVMVTVKSSYDGVPRDVYLYTLPLKPKKLDTRSIGRGSGQ